MRWKAPEAHPEAVGGGGMMRDVLGERDRPPRGLTGERATPGVYSPNSAKKKEGKGGKPGPGPGQRRVWDAQRRTHRRGF